MTTTMKAALYTQYGSPDVLQIKELEKPLPQDNQVLVKVHATTVSAVDSIFRSGRDFSARLFWGITKPRHHILGSTFAGEVESIGKDVRDYQPGERVFGISGTSLGAHVEYLCLEADALLTTIPATIDYDEAVATTASLTPLYFMRELTTIQEGQKVLVNGASGAVGSFAVQLAKYYGAEVTGVCSGRNIELVKSLGADHVIDYTRDDFSKNHNHYDIIFDAVGKSSFSQSKAALTENGLYMTISVSPAILWQMFWTSRFGTKKAVVGFAGLNYKAEDLVFAKELVKAGEIKSLIDRCYPLSEIAEAHRYVDTGRKKGNVIITMAHQN